MSDFLSELRDSGSLPGLATLTDDEWNERDRMVGERREAETESARMAMVEEAISYLQDRGLSSRHLQRATQGGLETTPAMVTARQDCGGIHVLSGSVGSGKTLAAHWWLVGDVVNTPIGRIRNAMMVTGPDLAAMSRYGDVFSRIKRCGRLAIDDLGTEYSDPKGSFMSDLDSVVDARWRACMPTMITTNLSPVEFKSRYGDRISDRIRDNGGWHNVSRPSMRGKD